MDLQKLSPDQVRAVLDAIAAIPEGRALLNSIDTIPPSTEIIDLASLMHTLFCKNRHPSGCDFYQEEELVDTWTREYHKFWLARATQLAERHELEGEELTNTVSEVVKVLNQFSALSTNAKAIFVDFLVELQITLRRSEAPPEPSQTPE